MWISAPYPALNLRRGTLASFQVLKIIGFCLLALMLVSIAFPTSPGRVSGWLPWAKGLQGGGQPTAKSSTRTTSQRRIRVIQIGTTGG